ncbi:MAG: Na(+)/H(+) antiporter subunit D [Maricaulaceae bacterium]
MFSALAATNPGLIVVALGALIGLTPWGYGRKGLALAAPLVAIAVILGGEFGVTGRLSLLGLELETYRLDRLSFLFGLIFAIAAFLNAIYALHERDRVPDAMGVIYAGSAIGAAFAGDLISLFVFWELTAISSVFLVWAGRTEAARKAGLRYLAIHVSSGVLLLAGAVMIYDQTGTIAFNAIGLDAGLGGLLIFLAFGIKCAFPFLHNWLQDAYPKASVTGTVMLSAFTTKLAVYALARGFPGEETLIWIGAVMTVFPVFFAVVENDLRRVLAYSLNNQLGFMVCGVGLGTALSINGAAAHAFVHILYKALLFMSMGAVLHRTGTAKASELGGLFRSMPMTTVFCVIGAASISAFPLFSGFVAKAMVLAEAADQHRWIVWGMLVFASAGVLEHSGIKIPFFAFFAHDSGRRVSEAPWNMLLAMGLAAGLCLLLGWPWGGYGLLYALLPFPEAAYAPYTWDHVVAQMQLLVAAMFAFAVLMRFGLYPPEKPGVILDSDWTYRFVGVRVARWSAAIAAQLAVRLKQAFRRGMSVWDRRLHAVFSPAGALARATPSSAAAIWTAAILALVLIASFLAS